MGRTSKHHETLTNGKGKCSVPMWCAGGPSGFCDQDAFGDYIPGPSFRDAWTGERVRLDGKYSGYVPALACPAHGGPPCPGLEIEPGVWSGCNQSHGDCPTCGK